MVVAQDTEFQEGEGQCDPSVGLLITIIIIIIIIVIMIILMIILQ